MKKAILHGFMALCFALVVIPSTQAAPSGATKAEQKLDMKQVQDQNVLLWFYWNNLRANDGWISTINYAKFTIKFTQKVKLQVSQTPSNGGKGSLHASYWLVKVGGDEKNVKSFPVNGIGIFSKEFYLEPGTYFINYATHTNFPVNVNGSVFLL